MVVAAVEQTGEVPSFADRLGERLVVGQPSGAVLEFLHFHSQLSSAPFFEPAVKSRLKRLSNFRHAGYARATRLQRDPARGNRLALVSAYTPGRRLADVMVLARRGRVQPKIAAVLSLTRQLMAGVALLHDYAPDVFHGALGPERLVIGPEGRLIITEYVLGGAVEQAVTEWGTVRLWRDYRLAALSDTSLARFGRRLDLVQIGLVTLSLLLGRPLAAGEFPDGLPALLDTARETTADGESLPLGASFKEWLTRLLHVEPTSAFRTLIEAQKAFGRMVDEDPQYGISSLAVEAFFQQCEEAALLPVMAAEMEAAEPLVAEPEAVAVAEAVAAPETVAAVVPPTASVAVAAGVAQPVVATSAPTDAPVIPPEPVAADPAPDPFAPWPAANPTETLSTLFDAFAPHAPARESEVVSTPDAAERSSPSPETATNDWTGLSGADAARGVRETLFDDERASVAEPEPLSRPVSPAPARSGPAPAVTPAHEWTLPAPAPAEPHVQVLDVQPAPQGVEEKPRASGPVAAAAARRTPAVLTYDELHKPTARPRSKAWLLVAAAVVVLALAGVLGGPRLWTALRSRGSASPEGEAAGHVQASAQNAVGGFKITTQPTGGRITIDGKARGTAPLQVTDLAPGVHSLVVETSWGTVEEAVTVEAGRVAPLTLSTVGWIKIASAVDLQVSEQGKTFGTTGQGALMVPAGRHHFDLVNQAVAVRLRQFVEVPPGQTVSVPVELPAGIVNLSSDQPAQVLLDGQVIGETPMNSVPVPLGAHEVVFRSARYGDVSYTVNVTLAAPVRLTVNFSKR